MAKVTFILKDGSEKEIDAPDGWSLMQLAVDAGIDGIEGACGGALACATCHVYIHPDWIDKVEAHNEAKGDEEEDMLDLAFDVKDSSRLGCQVLMNEELDGLIVAVGGADVDW